MGLKTVSQSLRTGHENQIPTPRSTNSHDLIEDLFSHAQHLPSPSVKNWSSVSFLPATTERRESMENREKTLRMPFTSLSGASSRPALQAPSALQSHWRRISHHQELADQLQNRHDSRRSSRWPCLRYGCQQSPQCVPLIMVCSLTWEAPQLVLGSGVSRGKLHLASLEYPSGFRWAGGNAQLSKDPL